MVATAFSDVSVGDEIPIFRRETGLANWNRFAAVNYEFVPQHMDDEAGSAGDLAGAFGMGNLQWSYLTAMLRDWLAGRGRIKTVSCQFRAPNLKGQVVEGHGRVIAVRPDDLETVVELEIWTQAGDSELARGTATVALRLDVL